MWQLHIIFIKYKTRILGRLNRNITRLLFTLIFVNSFSQSNIFKTIPEEDIFVTTNTNLLVAGETLFYKLHCFNKSTNELSNISKMAYIMLISDSKEIVFEHKHKLESGLTNGDFYISANLTTGQYKLVSYTKWMSNNKETPFINLDIYIVNPFTGRRNISYSSKRGVDSIALKHANKFQKTKNNTIKINTDSEVYNTRSKVLIQIDNANIFSNKGNYTISVRKVDSVEIVKDKTAQLYTDIEKTNTEFSIPEIRGEIISGKILLKEDDTPASDKIVDLSVSGNKNIYKNVKTDKTGKFYFSLYEKYTSGKLIIQLLDSNADKYKITIDDSSFNHIDKFVFNQVSLNPNIKNWLLNKSINNQIESSFFESKKDSLLNENNQDVFYGKASIDFVLDDYTRFPTVKETFVEVIKGAGVRRVNGEQKVLLFNPDNEQENQIENLETLILIDGIPIQNHEIVLEFDTKRIEKISIINEVYFYGPKVYNGILAIYTKKSDFTLSYKVPHLKKEIVSPENKKLYYNQNYNEKQKETSRIPDFRTQLLWEPNFLLKEKSRKVEFYTSDVKGVFQILLEGYSSDGKYIKINKYFKVE